MNMYSLYDPLKSDNFRRWMQELIFNTPTQSNENMSENANGYPPTPTPTIPSFQHTVGQSTLFDTNMRNGDGKLPNSINENSTLALRHQFPNQPTFSLNPLPLNPQDSNQCLTVSTSPTEYHMWAWCPIDIQSHGDCRIAGFYKPQPRDSFQFIETHRVLEVSDQGRTIRTSDGKVYKLHGSMAWWIYVSDSTLPEDALALPAHLEEAFAKGFPLTQWRTWTQGLNYFVASASVRSSNKAAIHPTNMATQTSLHYGSGNTKPQTPAPVEPCRKAMPYQRIVSSYQPVDLDFNSNSNLDNEEASDSGSSFNTFSSEASTQSEDAVSEKALPKRSRIVGRQSKLKTITFEERIQRGRPPKVGKITSKKKKTSPSHKAQTSTKKPKPLASTGEGMLVYTVNGPTRIKKLQKSRSGRLIYPRLDTRYSQSIAVSEDGSLSMCSDTKYLGY